jgi:7-cyano-7-deazaguanine reductase
MMTTPINPAATNTDDLDRYIYSVKAEDAYYPAVEAWANLNPHRNFKITIKVPEFTSVCPMTGLPDFGTITIEYIPDQLCVELKAFKFYMLAYRNVGMFYENITNKVLDDVVKAINPRWIRVHSDFSSRGGISTEADVIWQQPGFVYNLGNC